MKKGIIRVIVILLIILNIIIFVNNYLERYNTYIILDTKNIWKIDKNNNVKKYNKNYIKKSSYSKAMLYTRDNEEIQGYFGSKDNYKFYKENLDIISNIYHDLIVIGNKKIKNYTYLIEENITDDDKKIVSDFLKNNSINNNDLYIQKAVLPNNQIIYDVFVKEEDETQSKKIIFYNQNSNSKIIYKSKSNNLKKSSLDRLADVNNDGYVDLILQSYIFNSSGNECYSLYQYNKSSNNFEPVINCEEE